MYYSPFSLGLGVFGVVFALGFLGILTAFIIALCKGVGRWNKNNQAPRLTVNALVVAKRTCCRHTGGDNFGTTTNYYATFEFESGDRQEFLVTGQEYGLMVEGDQGQLTFQGTRFLGFSRG